jgi:DNA-binding NtrC family response regulator
MLADDDEALRGLVRRMLTKNGYHVLQAADGREALDVANAHGGPIHLLLTDIIMPNVNGIVLAERLLRQRPETAVLFMSGYMEATILAAKNTSVTVLQKPFTEQRLIDTVQQVLPSKALEPEEETGVE